MTSLERGFVVQPGEGDTFWVADSTITVMAGAEATGGAMTIMECHLPQGFGAGYHLHLNDDELFYVIEGKLRARCGQDVWVVEKGGCAYFPKGIPHSPKAEGDGPVRLLAITAPGGFERSLFEALPRERGGAFDLAKFIAANRRNGMGNIPPDYTPPEP